MIQTERGLSFIDEGTVAVKTGYSRYQELGGIINEDDYQKALERAQKTTSLKKILVAQAEFMAHVTGIRLNNSQDHLDRITILYGVLRTDSNPTAQYHHSQMCDQRLFAEALRMLDLPELLESVIAAYPNIHFV